ncbi:MAG: sugar ABC transporter substrate-binding protein [Candidatus Omnitrophica bacterium]|nr:sugar ABC transporter substrate-binding protein [Candidatus Omnitrophota bacterium]
MKAGKILFTLLIGILSLSLVLVGCGKKEITPSAGLRGAESNGPVEIKVAFWGAPYEVNIITDIIREWQASHPDILVRLEHTPYRGYVDKLLTRIAGRAAPDIICTEVDLFVTFQSKGVLLDLMPYISNDPSLKLQDFYPEIINRFTVDGKLYCIPRDTAPFACVYYNKKLFDEAGVPYPSDNWDIYDMLDKAKKLTKTDKDGRVIQYGFYAWAWQNFVYAFGGSLVDNVKKPTRCTLDSEEAKAGIQFYADLINKHKVQPSMTAMSNLAMGVQGMFMTGRLAMFASGIWETAGLRKITDFEWDVAMFPKGPRGIRGFGTGGSGYCILKESKHPKEAFEVVKALAGREAQMKLAETCLAQPAMIPIAMSNLWAYDGKVPHNKKMLNEAMRYVIYEPFSASWREAREMYIIPEWDLVFNGKKTVAEAVNNFISKVNALLKGEKSY